MYKEGIEVHLFIIKFYFEEVSHERGLFFLKIW